MDKQEKSLEFLFNQAKKQDSKTPFDKVKAKLDHDIISGRKLNSPKGKGLILNVKTILIMILGGTLITASIVLFISYSSEKDKTEMNESSIKKTDLSPRIFDASSFPNHGTMTINSVEIKEDAVYETTTTYTKDNTEEVIVIAREDYLINETIKPWIEKKPIGKNQPYQFPNLDEEQRKETAKQKAKMLKSLFKKDKKQYVYIPSGTYQVDSKNVSVQAFWMRNTEITVLEYRTYLFDLLIQDRKEEFLKAKPNQELWNKIPGFSNTNNQPMVENYFSHPAYNEYPVNNISREGAELYCKWLTLELEKEYGDKMEEEFSDVRIPSEYEWMYAAYGGHKEQLKYPWNTNALKRGDACYLANYKPRVKDSTGTLVDNFMIDGGFYTVKVDSYEPNDFGLYNMSGNVAEMVVLNKDLKTPAVKGGGWLDNAEQLSIRAKAQYIGLRDGNVNVGFRPVMTYLSN